MVWFHSLWTPPPETESLLFAVQAAIGASIIFWFIGNEHGKREMMQKMKKGGDGKHDGDGVGSKGAPKEINQAPAKGSN